MTAGGPAARHETFFSASRLVAPTLLAGCGSKSLCSNARTDKALMHERMRVGLGIDHQSTMLYSRLGKAVSTAVVASGGLEEAH